MLAATVLEAMYVKESTNRGGILGGLRMALDLF